MEGALTLRTHCDNQTAQHRDRARKPYEMWWTPHCYVNAVNPVPPIVERRGHHHLQRARAKHKDAQRRPQAQDGRYFTVSRTTRRIANHYRCRR